MEVREAAAWPVGWWAFRLDEEFVVEEGLGVAPLGDFVTDLAKLGELWEVIWFKYLPPWVLVFEFSQGSLV